METYSEQPLAAFTQQFLRSPVRWVVFAHVVLLLSVIACNSAIPGSDVLQWMDAVVVTAQGALLVIWIALNGEGTARRTVGAAFLLSVIQLAHVPVAGILVAMPGMICTVPGTFILLTVVSLPMLAAQARGLELVRFEASNMPPPRRLQFSIRGAMLASVGAAVLFGLKGVAESAFSDSASLGTAAAAAFAILAMTLVGVGIYLSIPLVAVWVVLTPGKVLPRMATALAAWMLGGMLIFHYTTLAEGRGHLELPLSVTAGATVIVLATLFALRTMRYRVVWDRDVELAAGCPFEPSSPFMSAPDTHDRDSPWRDDSSEDVSS